MSVIIPDTARPSNLHFADTVNVKHLDGDVLGICERVKEISPRLSIVVADRGDDYAFIVMEHCDDGVERLVCRAKELDGRLITKLQKMLANPVTAKRILELEEEERRLEKEVQEETLNELYERMGRPMLTELDKCAFIDGRPISYPKKGVAQAGKHG